MSNKHTGSSIDDCLHQERCKHSFHHIYDERIPKGFELSTRHLDHFTASNLRSLYLAKIYVMSICSKCGFTAHRKDK